VVLEVLDELAEVMVVSLAFPFFLPFFKSWFP